MASDHSREAAGGAKATFRTILEPITFSTASWPAPASGNDKNPPRFISVQGNRVPQKTTPTAPPSSSPLSSSTIPLQHLSSLHRIADSISAALLNSAPPQPSSDVESSHEDGPFLSRIPSQDGAALAQSKVIAGERSRSSAVLLKVQPSTVDHSYATHETTTIPNDTAADQIAASDSSTGYSDSSVEEGNGDRGGSPSPPSPIRRRVRTPKNTAGTEEGEDRDPSSPSVLASSRERLSPLNAIKFKGHRGRGCGCCSSCMKEDCGMCRFCWDKPKFGGPGKKKQRCAARVCTNLNVGRERLQRCTLPTERYEGLESSTPGKSVAEILQFYDDGKARMLSVVPAMAPLQWPQLAGEHEPHLQISEKQSTEVQSSYAATTEEAMKAPLIVEHPVVTKPSRITMPHAVEIPVETDNPIQSSDVGNGVANKEQQLEMKMPAEVKAPLDVRAPPTEMDLSPGKESIDDTSKDTSATTAGDKQDSPSSMSPRIPQTRSQAEKERSKSVSSLAVEKLKMSAKHTKEGRRRTLSFFHDFDMKCLFCGRQRKLSVARSEKFCSRRCIQQWSETHPGEEPEGLTSEEERIPGVSPVSRPSKRTNSRELKNLQIDMTLPGKGSSPTVRHRRSPLRNPLSPVLGPSPRPLSSPAVSIYKATPSAKMSDVGDTGHTNSGTKRASASQPESKKKPCDGDYYHLEDATATTTKAADLGDFTHPTTTMVLPISAPLLTRTVPPPPVSIIHMSQIPSLVSALSNLTEPRSHSRGLSSNIRNWSLEQVVQYFGSIQDCWDYLEIFREHDLDGSALLLLTHESLVKCLGIKLGHALKIMRHVEELRSFYDTSS